MPGNGRKLPPGTDDGEGVPRSPRGSGPSSPRGPKGILKKSRSGSQGSAPGRRRGSDASSPSSTPAADRRLGKVARNRGARSRSELTPKGAGPEQGRPRNSSVDMGPQPGSPLSPERGVAGKSASGRKRAVTRMESILQPADNATELLAEVDTWAVISEVLDDAWRVAVHGMGDAPQMSTAGVADEDQTGYESMRHKPVESDTITLNSGIPERAILLGQAVNNDPAAVAVVLKKLAARSDEMSAVKRQIKDLRKHVAGAKAKADKNSLSAEKKLRAAQRKELKNFVEHAEDEFKTLEGEVRSALKSTAKSFRGAQSADMALAAAVPQIVADKESSSVSPSPQSKRRLLSPSRSATHLGKSARGEVLNPPTDLSLRICWFSSGIESEFSPLKYDNSASLSESGGTIGFSNNAAIWEAQQQGQTGLDEDDLTFKKRTRSFAKLELRCHADEMRLEGEHAKSDLRLEHEKKLHDLERRQMTQMTDQWKDATFSEQKRARQLLQEAHHVLLFAMITAQRLAEGYLIDLIHAKQWMKMQKENATARKEAAKELKKRKKDMKRRQGADRKGKSKEELQSLSVDHLAELEKLARDSRDAIDGICKERESKLALKQLEQRETLAYSHGRFLSRRVRKLCSVERKLLRQLADVNRQYLQNTYEDAQATVAELQADEAQMLRDEFADMLSMANGIRDETIKEAQEDFSLILRDWAQKSARQLVGKSRSMLSFGRRNSKGSQELVKTMSEASFVELSPDGRGTVNRGRTSRSNSVSVSIDIKGQTKEVTVGEDDYNGFIHETVRQCVMALGLRNLRRKGHLVLNKQQRELDVWTEHRQQRLDFEKYWFAVFEDSVQFHADEAKKLSSQQWTWLRKMGFTVEPPSGEPRDVDEESFESLLRDKFGITQREIAPKLPQTREMTKKHVIFVKSVKTQWDVVKVSLQARWKAENRRNDADIQWLLTASEEGGTDASHSGDSDMSSLAGTLQTRPKRRRRVSRKVTTRKAVKRVRTVQRKVKTRKMRKRTSDSVPTKRRVRKTRPVQTDREFQYPSGVEAFCVAKHAYTARKDDQLAIEIGDLIAVTRKKQSGWWVGYRESSDVDGENRPKESKKFPSNFVDELSLEDASKRLNGSAEGKEEESYSSTASSASEVSEMESYSTFTEEEVETEVSSFTDTDTDELVTASESDEEGSSSSELRMAVPNMRTFGRIAPEVLQAAQEELAVERDEITDASDAKRSSTMSGKKATWKPGTQLAREMRAGSHTARRDEFTDVREATDKWAEHSHNGTSSSDSDTSSSGSDASLLSYSALKSALNEIRVQRRLEPTSDSALATADDGERDSPSASVSASQSSSVNSSPRETGEAGLVLSESSSAGEESAEEAVALDLTNDDTVESLRELDSLTAAAMAISYGDLHHAAQNATTAESGVEEDLDAQLAKAQGNSRSNDTSSDEESSFDSPERDLGAFSTRVGEKLASVGVIVSTVESSSGEENVEPQPHAPVATPEPVRPMEESSGEDSDFPEYHSSSEYNSETDVGVTSSSPPVSSVVDDKAATDEDGEDFDWILFLSLECPKLSAEALADVADILEEQDLTDGDFKVMSDEFLRGIGIADEYRQDVLDCVRRHQ